MTGDWSVLAGILSAAPDPRVHLVALVSSLVVIGVIETLHPRRAAPGLSAARWLGNCVLAIVNMALVEQIYPDAESLSARFAAIDLTRALGGPGPLAVAIGVVVIDLGRYAMHRANHVVPWLWRFHAIHHADLELDVTTSFRHHPVEYALIGAATLGVVVVLGLPVAALGWYAVVSAVFAPLQHGNVALPGGVDRLLRLFVVTGAVHAVHHSVELRQGNSNFAIVLPWWDRLFGTYVDPRTAPAASLAFGVAGLEAGTANSLWRLLALPFRRVVPGGQA